MYKCKYRYTKEVRGEADNIDGMHGEVLYTVAGCDIPKIYRENNSSNKCYTHR